MLVVASLIASPATNAITDPRDFRCAGATADRIRSPTDAENRAAYARAQRLPWRPPGSVPLVSAGRISGIARSGGPGDDRLEGTTGDDYFNAAGGDDRMIGGPGVDIYVFTTGDGRDEIEDAQGAGVLAFLADVPLEQIWARPDGGGGLIVNYGLKERITIRNYSSLRWFVESTCGGGALPLEKIVIRRT